MGATYRLLMLFALVAILSTAIPHVLAAQVQNGLPTEGCAITTPTGLIPDRDCDGLDDYRDNCKYAPNSQQEDANGNAIGDACDLLVTAIDLDPSTRVGQGGLFTVKVHLINNKAYGITDVQARVRNTAMAIDLKSFVESMRPGEQRTLQFVLKAPGCAKPGTYELTFTTDHKEGSRVYTQSLYQRISVAEKEGACADSASALDNTLLETLLLQEAEPGESVIFPVTVTNANDEAKSYRLSLADISAIGTYRVDPAPEFTVPAGKSERLSLYIQTEGFAPLGRNPITFVLESEGEQERTTVQLRILTSANAPLGQVLGLALRIALILILLALIVGAGIVAYKKLNEEPGDAKEEGDGKRPPKRPRKGTPAVEEVSPDEEFQSYY